MLNPDCTPGDVVRDALDPLSHAWLCDCGAGQGGYPSRTKAKAAQREHRFPPRSDPVNLNDPTPGMFTTESGAVIVEGVCRLCSRLLYQAREPVDGEFVTVDTWHPFGILAGNPTARVDGVMVETPSGDCSSASTGRPGDDAFVVGVPLYAEEDGWPPPACYICGDPTDHDRSPCPTGLLREQADDLRAAVGLFPYPHPKRRDPNV
jgi:hypothetical protein